MKYYHTYKDTLIEVGSLTDGGEVVALSNARVTVRTSDGCTINLRTNGPNYKQYECPNIAVYDRISGKRLLAGDTTSTGIHIDVIYDSCVRTSKPSTQDPFDLRTAPEPVEYIWLELAANKSHVECGVELVSYPAFEELEQRKRTTALNNVCANGNTYPAGTVCVRGARNKLLPAADCIWIDGHYRLISDYVYLVSSGCYIKASSAADFVDAVGGGAALESETMLLTAGAHAGQRAYLYDVYAMPDGNVAMMNEMTLVRSAGGEVYVLDVPEDYTIIDGIAHSPDSLVNCAGSGEQCWRGATRRVDGQLYSRSWFDAHAGSCNCCGNYFIPAAGATRCDSCRLDGKYRVQSYSNREANYFKPERNVPIKFGIELEVGCDRGFKRSTCTKTIVDAIGIDDYAVLKEDGSISECSGFEIVTRPDAPEVHKRVWLGALAVPEVRQQMSSWTNGKCGIHIHVSRKPLSDLWVGRMLVLINADSMQSLVHTVAGRGSSSYTKYIKKKLTDGLACELSDDRYEALNTSGEHTIEFRIFRGTLEPAGFIKNIEFVEAVLAYCKPAARSLRDIDKPDKFIEFVYKSRKQYPVLNEFLQKKCIN